MSNEIEKLIKTLESDPSNLADYIKPIKKSFIPNLELTYSVYKELSGLGRKEGPAIYSRIVLAGRSISDLIAGFHLATQGYIQQSYAVLRPIIESADLIKLFNKNPELVDVWMNGGKESWNKLKPTEVRKLLGKNSYDEIYGHFCDSGAHPSFNSLSAMAAMKIGQEKPRITVWIGGVHNEYAKPRIFFLMGFIFLLQITILIEITRLCNQYSGKDYFDSLVNSIQNFGEFFTYAGSELQISEVKELNEIKKITDEFLKDNK